MKTLSKKILLPVLGLIVVISIVAIIWKRDKIFSSGVVTPISSGDVVQNVILNVEKTGLSLVGIPFVLGDTIQASISGAKVIFGVDKDISSQVRALQLVLGKLTINRLPKEIDLRFNKKIVRY